jgi:urease accessory protein
MKLYTEIIGNIWRSADWKKRVERTEQDVVRLDRWNSQKSRMLVAGESGRMYRISLGRGDHLSDGDIIEYSPNENRSVVVRVEMTQVLVVDMEQALASDHQTLMRIAVELGHALGNQHWPAVVKDHCVYVPLVADKKVMMSVMNTHRIEGITYSFKNGTEVIPYLSPHEVRMLFAAHDEPVGNHKHTIHV